MYNLKSQISQQSIDKLYSVPSLMTQRCRSCSDHSNFGRYTFASKNFFSNTLPEKNIAIDICTSVLTIAWKIVLSTTDPHQPRTFQFPKKTVVKCNLQPSWFTKWPCLHYVLLPGTEKEYCEVITWAFQR